MNKYELKYCLEDESTKVKDLIDINGKNAHHIQDLYEEIKELKIHNKKLIVRMNDKTEENIKLKNIIRSQQEKNLAEYQRNDPIFTQQNEINSIRLEKQKLIREIEVLKNG